MPFIDFAELKRNVGIEQVLTMLQLNLKRQGQQLRGPCPACKSGGDLFQFIFRDCFCHCCPRASPPNSRVEHSTT